MPSHERSADLAWRHPCLQLLRVMVVEVHEQFLKGMNAAYWYTTTVSCSKKGHRTIGALFLHFQSRDEKRNRLTTDAVSHPHSQGQPDCRVWCDRALPRQLEHRGSAPQRESWKGLGMMHVDDCHSMSALISVHVLGCPDVSFLPVGTVNAFARLFGQDWDTVMPGINAMSTQRQEEWRAAIEAMKNRCALLV